jgi:general secretion pathway protein N
MKRWSLLAAGALIYLLLLVAMAPATLFDAIFRDLSAGKLRLAEARGTVWSGAGQITLVDPVRKSGLSKPLSWHFVPASILLGHLVCELTPDSSKPRIVARIYPNRIEIGEADVTAPAALLGILVPKLGPFGLGGELQLRTTGLVFGNGNPIKGLASIRWRAASSVHTPVSPLGDYEFVFENQGNAAAMRLRTLEGPLQLDGNGSWHSGTRPVFAATARVPSQYQERLEPFMRMFAAERGAGTFELQLQ